MYYLTDNRYVNLVVSKLRRFSNWLNSGKLRKYLIESEFDVIVSTHFFAGEVISDMKKNGLIKSRLVTVVTDYRLHLWWVADFTDAYVVSNEDAKSDLISQGVPAEKIKVLGIPAEPAFARKLDPDSVKDKYGITKGVFTVLTIGGGFGVGPIEDIAKEMDKVSGAIQVIVICGHNEALHDRINALSKDLKIKLKVFGFVDNVYEYMDASDILISKSGGITVSESLAKELPMIVIAPIPGQETRNCDFLIRHNAAIKLGSTGELAAAVSDLVAHPEKMNSMKESIRKIKKPDACFDIAKLALN